MVPAPLEVVDVFEHGGVALPLTIEVSDLLAELGLDFFNLLGFSLLDQLDYVLVHVLKPDDVFLGQSRQALLMRTDLMLRAHNLLLDGL